MSYQKHNFQNGEALYAEQLNQIEDEIARMNQDIDSLADEKSRPVVDLTCRVDNLEVAANGYLYQEDEHEGVSYVEVVPENLLPYATISSIGGRSLVWNQLVKGFSNQTKDGFTFTISDDRTSLHVEGTLSGTANGWYNPFSTPGYQVSFIKDHYYWIDMHIKGNYGGLTGISIESIGLKTRTWKNKFQATATTSAVGNIQLIAGQSVDYTMRPQIFDLTVMFGKERAEAMTEQECIDFFAADYYQYTEKPELMSFSPDTVVSNGESVADFSAIVQKYFPEGMKSAGTVHDSFDVDADGKVWAVKRVSDDTTDDGLSYIPLLNPILVKITEDFSFGINVEAGGSLVFANDKGSDYHVPLPHAVRWTIRKDVSDYDDAELKSAMKTLERNMSVDRGLNIDFAISNKSFGDSGLVVSEDGYSLTEKIAVKQGQTVEYKVRVHDRGRVIGLMTLGEESGAYKPPQELISAALPGYVKGSRTFTENGSIQLCTRSEYIEYSYVIIKSANRIELDKIGDLTNLQTTAKDNIVEAINELANQVATLMASIN